MASTTSSVRVGIVGYGNLGRGVEAAIAKNPDMQLVGIYTRRDPAQLKPLHAGTPCTPWTACSRTRAGRCADSLWRLQG